MASDIADPHVNATALDIDLGQSSRPHAEPNTGVQMLTGMAESNLLTSNRSDLEHTAKGKHSPEAAHASMSTRPASPISVGIQDQPTIEPVSKPEESRDAAETTSRRDDLPAVTNDDTFLEEQMIFFDGAEGQTEDRADNSDDTSGNNAVDVGDDPFCRRHLRPQGRTKRDCPTTWMDTDDTGNYNPDSEARELRRKRFCGPRHRNGHRNIEDVGVELQAREYKAVASPTMPVTLKFPTAPGRRQFGELLSALAVQDQSEQGTRRTRSRISSGDALATEEDEGVIDLTGKPFARGCKQCVAIFGYDTSNGCCSLVNDERDWPCQLCKESGEANECELLVAPTRKRACEDCKRKRIACSFTSTRNHEGPCQECLTSRTACIAGPVKDSIQPRLRCDRDWKANPPRKKRKGKARAPADCLECCKSGRRCHYSTDDDSAPCMACKNGNLPCTVNDGRDVEVEARAKTSPSVEKAKPTTSSGSQLPLGSQNCTGADGQELSLLSKTHRSDHDEVRHKYSQNSVKVTKPTARLRKIQTSFSHPISFNCDKDSDKHDKCHFHRAPPLAMFGFGRVEVTVIDKVDGSAFLEYKGGHRSDAGIERTKICTECTSDRSLKLLCEGHTMRPIPNIPRERPDPEKALQALCDGKRALDEFCDVCANLAVYQCGTSSEAGTCELKLCKGCAVAHARSGDFDNMLKQIAQQRGKELRADLEFLRKDGPLYRHFVRDMGLS